MTTIVVIAKETIAGRVKTRLHPPLSLQQAADLAAAALADSLEVVTRLAATRRILAFDGNRLPPGSEAFEIHPQSTGDLDMRLGAIFDRCDGPTVLIGMDTPQLSAATLAPLCAAAAWTETDAWIGFANDGGFWCLGLAEPDGALVRGVPMSLSSTGTVQLERLTSAGLRVSLLPELIDVDTIDDARAVALLAPQTRFARTLKSFEAAPSSTQQGSGQE